MQLQLTFPTEKNSDKEKNRNEKYVHRKTQVKVCELV